MSLSIYIHFPYCIRKCPFCDFNSYGVGGKFPETEYTNSLITELKNYESIIRNQDIISVFLGGGTPSLFSPSCIENLLNRISKLGYLVQNAEITIEVNPKTADYNKFKALSLAGINRVSIGMQSFSMRKLELLGRLNNPDDNYRTIDDLKRSRIDNINIDLMYGTPGETLEEWSVDLHNATELSPQHISAYCLTIENGTEFYKKYIRGELILPEEEILLAFMDHTRSYLNLMGYLQYEVSNYSIQNYSSVHNTVYWTGENYLGIGAGAHSYLKTTVSSEYGARWSNYRNPSVYMKKIMECGSAIDSYEELNRLQSFQDSMMMGLRLLKGINVLNIKTRYGYEFNSDKLSTLIEEGLLDCSGNHISITGKGMPLSNYIISSLVDNICTV